MIIVHSLNLTVCMCASKENIRRRRSSFGQQNSRQAIAGRHNEVEPVLTTGITRKRRGTHSHAVILFELMYTLH